MTSNNNQSSTYQLARFWPVLYILIVAGLLYAWFFEWAYDDPFITYRYAQNLINGVGFVYNPGLRVQSTTTPLFALLLAGFSIFWSDLPKLANLLGALSLAVGAVLFWDLARTWKTPVVGYAALFLYPFFPLLLTTMGSETPLYLALCLGSFAAYARGNYTWTAIFSGLAVLTRPDGILVPIILALDYLIRIRRPIPWKAVIIFTVITIPWFIFAWIYFGTPLPVTLAAKQGQGSMAISEKFAPGLLTTVKPYLRESHYRIETALMLIGMGYLIWRGRFDTGIRRWGIFLAWPIVYFITYALLGVSRYFWYYAPLIPGFLALVGLGTTGIVTLAFSIAGYLTRRFQTGIKPGRETLNPLYTAFAVALIAILAVYQVGNLNRLRQQVNGRYPIYRHVGEWLRSNTPEDASVGTLEVGIIGYYAQRPMLGFAGLIEPEIAGQLSKNTTYSDSAIWTLENLHPTYLVIQEGVFPELETRTADHCRIIEKFPGDRYHYQHNLILYACSF